MFHLISKPEHPPRRWSQLQRLTGVGSSTQTVAAVPQRSSRSWRVSNGLWLYGLAGAAQVGRQPDDRLVDATQQPGHAEQGGPTVGLGGAGGVGLRCVDGVLGGGNLSGLAAMQQLAQRVEVGSDAGGGGLQCRRPPRLADVVGKPSQSCPSRTPFAHPD
jgi:hypothetical protein